MNPSAPFMTLSNTILWLKVALSLVALALVYFRYRAAAPKTYSLRTKALIVAAVIFSFGVFHNLGSFRGGSFLHYGEMFHYYLGSKYFKELGYYDLYTAVIVADTEQGNVLASLPFYTDLKSYKNIQRKAALREEGRIKGLFSPERWAAFKDDVTFFRKATDTPTAPGLMFLLMDHGYNASPVSTLMLGILTNLVPLAHVHLIASIDVFLVLIMIALVFGTFGLETGALFAVYFFVNILSGQEYLSGSLLRYDWLLYIVAAVCLLHKRRYAAAAFFLTLSAMLRIFPIILFYGVAVTLFQRAKATRTLDKNSIRFIATAGVTALVLFLLPAVTLGSVARPWKDFYAKTDLHNSGVYVNHIGLRGVVLFEPSHLSLERFIQTYQSTDVVRRWQDVKENEFRNKKPLIIFASLVVLACVTAIIWKRREEESLSVLWPLLLVYTTSYLSSYYYTFLCLLILLFFRRPDAHRGFVPVCLLLILNVVALLTDYFKPSPIAFFSLINIYLFVCLASILGFESYTSVLGTKALEPAANLGVSHKPSQERRRTRGRTK